MTERMILFVGCRNRAAQGAPATKGRGISVLGFDPKSGAAQPISETLGIDNPTFLAVDPERLCLYATSEVAGWCEGIVSAYRFNPATNTLVYLNKQPTLGSTTAYLSLTHDRRFLLAANYADGSAVGGPNQAVVVFPIRGDGSLAPASGTVAHHGSGADSRRQAGPHAHCVIPSPDDRFALVADLGIAALYAHRLTGDGQLEPGAPFPMAAGSGPRHLALHPSGGALYAINELDSTVTVLAFDGANGSFRSVQTLSTLPPDATGVNHTAGLQLTPDGRFLYGSNRGHDSIAIFAVDAATGRLTALGHRPCGGKTPRAVGIDPGGRCLLVANQNSDTVVIFRIDRDNGALAAIGRIEIGTPMCVAFLAL